MVEPPREREGEGEGEGEGKGKGGFECVRGSSTTHSGSGRFGVVEPPRTHTNLPLCVSVSACMCVRVRACMCVCVRA